MPTIWSQEEMDIEDEWRDEHCLPRLDRVEVSPGHFTYRTEEAVR